LQISWTTTQHSTDAQIVRIGAGKIIFSDLVRSGGFC
jgi:hypothetical protein